VRAAIPVLAIGLLAAGCPAPAGAARGPSVETVAVAPPVTPDASSPPEDPRLALLRSTLLTGPELRAPIGDAELTLHGGPAGRDIGPDDIFAPRPVDPGVVLALGRDFGSAPHDDLEVWDERFVFASPAQARARFEADFSSTPIAPTVSMPLEPDLHVDQATADARDAAGTCDPPEQTFCAATALRFEEHAGYVETHEIRRGAVLAVTKLQFGALYVDSLGQKQRAALYDLVDARVCAAFATSPRGHGCVRESP
jgi:hypothetical protein